MILKNKKLFAILTGSMILTTSYHASSINIPNKLNEIKGKIQKIFPTIPSTQETILWSVLMCHFIYVRQFGDVDPGYYEIIKALTAEIIVQKLHHVFKSDNSKMNLIRGMAQFGITFGATFPLAYLDFDVFEKVLSLKEGLGIGDLSTWVSYMTAFHGFGSLIYYWSKPKINLSLDQSATELEKSFSNDIIELTHNLSEIDIDEFAKMKYRPTETPISVPFHLSLNPLPEQQITESPTAIGLYKVDQQQYDNLKGTSVDSTTLTEQENSSDDIIANSSLDLDPESLIDRINSAEKFVKNVLFKALKASCLVKKLKTKTRDIDDSKITASFNFEKYEAKAKQGIKICQLKLIQILTEDNNNSASKKILEDSKVFQNLHILTTHLLKDAIQDDKDSPEIDDIIGRLKFLDNIIKTRVAQLNRADEKINYKSIGAKTKHACSKLCPLFAGTALGSVIMTLTHLPS